MILIGNDKSDDAWFWVATEPIHRQILGVYISRHRNMLVAESFLLKSLIKFMEYMVYILMAEAGIRKHVSA
jgi:transposase-like protein